MYLRHSKVKKSGKTHTYWRLVRSVRQGRKVRQETVAYLGALDSNERKQASALAKHFLGERADQLDFFEDRSSVDLASVRVRGMASAENLEWLQEGERKYVIGTPKSELRKFEQELLDREGWEQIRDVRHLRDVKQTTKDTKSTKMEFDDLSNRVIGCAIEVHRQLGPGLLESAYEQCVAHELSRNAISYRLQHPQPVQYKDIRLDCGYRIDILVEDRLIVELKSVDEIKGIHQVQLLTYMKLSGVKIGLLVNFNVSKLKEGIKRFVL